MVHNLHVVGKVVLRCEKLLGNTALVHTQHEKKRQALHGPHGSGAYREAHFWCLVQFVKPSTRTHFFCFSAPCPCPASSRLQLLRASFCHSQADKTATVREYFLEGSRTLIDRVLPDQTTSKLLWIYIYIYLKVINMHYFICSRK